MSSQEERWNQHYNEILQFMQDQKRRPSKHYIEDRHMVHWIKYNKKLLARHELAADRVEKFNQLMDIADSFLRVNQYAYVTPQAKDAGDPQELSLF